MSATAEIEQGGALPALAAEHLRSGARLKARARGYSMWPFYRDGVLVEIESCRAADLEIGDVALVETSKGLLLHRVVGHLGQGLLTKGDARRRVDGVIPPKRVLGRAPSRPGDRLLGHLSPRVGWGLWLAANIYRQFFDRFKGRI